MAEPTVYPETPAADKLLIGPLLEFEIMGENQWRETVGAPVSSEEAWRVLDEWRVKQNEIGMLFCARSGIAVLSAMCTVRAARNGMLQLKGEDFGASLNLKQDKFTYGPMQVWPHWPAPPTVEVLAFEAYLAGGEWLVLAQGYLPKELSPLALPM